MQATVQTRACAGGCGRQVPLPDPEMAGIMRPHVLRVVEDPEAAVWCDECLEREEREEHERERIEREARAAELRRARMGMPPKWRALSFAHLEADVERRRAFELAQAWGRGELRGLVLFGPVGRGKTALAAAAANALVERMPVRWLPVSELLMDLSASFGSPERERAQRRLDAERGRAALVLDDLDKLKPTEHAVQPLYVAVNGWIEAELPLLVTLNRDLDALNAWLPETFGEAIGSRLAGYCSMKRVAGRDRRLG